MKNINDYVISIHDNMEEKIKTIRAIEYHYNLTDFFKELKGLSKDVKHQVLEETLNKYLILLKPIYTKDGFKKISREIDDITDFFIDDFDDCIVSEGDLVADDLTAKLIGDNGRKLELPVKLSYLKEYCISSLISTKDIDKAIMWIILRLATIYYCLSYPKNSSI